MPPDYFWLSVGFHASFLVLPFWITISLLGSVGGVKSLSSGGVKSCSTGGVKSCGKSSLVSSLGSSPFSACSLISFSIFSCLFLSASCCFSFLSREAAISDKLVLNSSANCSSALVSKSSFKDYYIII